MTTSSWCLLVIGPHVLLYLLAPRWCERHHTALAYGVHATLAGLAFVRRDLLVGRARPRGPAAALASWLVNTESLTLMFFALGWQVPLG